MLIVPFRIVGALGRPTAPAVAWLPHHVARTVTVAVLPSSPSPLMARGVVVKTGGRTRRIWVDPRTVREPEEDEVVDLALAAAAQGMVPASEEVHGVWGLPFEETPLDPWTERQAADPQGGPPVSDRVAGAALSDPNVVDVQYALARTLRSLVDARGPQPGHGDPPRLAMLTPEGGALGEEMSVRGALARLLDVNAILDAQGYPPDMEAFDIEPGLASDSHAGWRLHELVAWAQTLLGEDRPSD